MGPTTSGAVESLEGVYLLILLSLSSPQELAKFMKSELEKWSKVVKESGMKVD